MSHSETSSKAEPYDLLGLFLSLLAIGGLTTLFCGFTAFGVILISPLMGESEFSSSVMALIRTGPAGISIEAETWLGYAFSYAIYAGLGAATLVVALFRAKTEGQRGQKCWEGMKQLTAFTPPVFHIRILVVALAALIYGLTVDLLLPRFLSACCRLDHPSTEQRLNRCAFYPCRRSGPGH